MDVDFKADETSINIHGQTKWKYFANGNNYYQYYTLTTSHLVIVSSSETLEPCGFKPHCLVCPKTSGYQDGDCQFCQYGKDTTGCIAKPPDPPKPPVCKSFYERLECYKQEHPSAFPYTPYYKTFNLGIGDKPHVELMFKDLDKLDLALKGDETLEKIFFARVEAVYWEEYKSVE